MNEKTKIDSPLDDLEQVQKTLIELITKFRDSYPDEPETAMTLKALRNASEEIHKAQMRIASGESNEVKIDE